MPGSARKWLKLAIGGLLLHALSTPARGRDVRADAVVGPPLPIGGPTTRAWREEALTEANELEGLAAWIAAHPDSDHGPDPALFDYVAEHLRAVRNTASRSDRPGGWRRLWALPGWLAVSGGASFERTRGNLDAVEADLLRLAPRSYVRGVMPSLLAHVNRFLQKADPRRTRLEQLAAKAETQPLEEDERGAVVAALHAANTQRRRDMLRVRSFRNVMFGAGLLLIPVAIGLAVFAYNSPTAIPVCFFPEEKHKVVCATNEIETISPAAVGRGEVDPATRDVDKFVDEAADPADVALIEVIGLIAAVVASTVALRNMRGTSTPYSLPVALAMLKIPLGALTAVLGLLLMSGGFVPGLSALDTSAQILGWALVFGYSQQLLTRLVDQRANSLLENVGGRGPVGERETK